MGCSNETGVYMKQTNPVNYSREVQGLIKSEFLDYNNEKTSPTEKILVSKSSEGLGDEEGDYCLDLKID